MANAPFLSCQPLNDPNYKASFWEVLTAPFGCAWDKLTYPNPPMPPTVRGTMPDGSAIPSVPPDGVDAGDIIQAITNQQIEDWQDQNMVFMQGVARNNAVDPIGGYGWLLALGVGFGAILVLKEIKK